MQFVLPESKQEKGIKAQHQRHSGNLALRIPGGGTQPPGEAPARSRHNDAKQENADRIVDEQGAPMQHF
jgi:hypothetical protein